MELEIYEAFRSAGVADDKAKAAVESINREIDRRYSVHASQLVTRGDLTGAKAELQTMIAATRADVAEAKAEIIKWSVGAMFTAVGLFAALSKLWH